MLNKVQLEYVESAWIILYQLTSNNKSLLAETTDLFQKNLKFVLEKFSDNKLIFSGLFNAYTEDKNVERLKSIINFNDTNGLHDFQYADSGGLQIVNTGAIVDDELKKKIYKYQAENSNFAFSFDEIPAYRNNDKTRTYVEEWVSPYGEKAGKNLQEHIEIFNQLKTETKLIPIIQGFDKDQIKTYTLRMLDQVKKSDIKKIGALACGNAHGNGFGTLDNFMTLHSLEIPKSLKKHTHLLGASGIDRIAPVLSLIRNGVVPDIERLSFDSSYHTQSYVYGEVQRSVKNLLDGTRIHRLGLVRNDYVERILKEMVEFWKDSPTFNFIDMDDLFMHSIYDSEGINSPVKQLKKRSSVSYCKNVNLIQMYIMFNIYKYITLLNDFIDDKLGFYELFHNEKYFRFYSGLATVKTFGEYQDWRTGAVNKFKFVRSNNIKSFEKSNNRFVDTLF